MATRLPEIHAPKGNDPKQQAANEQRAKDATKAANDSNLRQSGFDPGAVVNGSAKQTPGVK